MIEIKKTKEPNELLQYRMQKFASYTDMPSKRYIKKSIISSRTERFLRVIFRSCLRTFLSRVK